MCVRVAIGNCSDGPNPWREEVKLAEIEILQNYFHQYKEWIFLVLALGSTVFEIATGR